MTNQVRRQSDENGFLQKIAAEEEDFFFARKRKHSIRKTEANSACMYQWLGWTSVRATCRTGPERTL